MKNNIKENRYRARRSVYPTNRIIASEHGVRQVLFPYGKHKIPDYLNLLEGLGKAVVVFGGQEKFGEMLAEVNRRVGG